MGGRNAGQNRHSYNQKNDKLPFKDHGLNLLQE
jgi:hypothetical protein